MYRDNEYELYTDTPHKHPKLNFGIYAEQLCKIVTKTPALNGQNSIESLDDDYSGSFTVGIFGSWGSGKTSLMREIERQLRIEEPENMVSDRSPRYKTIWFNPWKYDGKEDVRNALIQTILRAIIADIEIKRQPSKRKEIVQFAKNFGKCSLGIAGQLVSVGLKAATDIDTRDISERIEEEIDICFSDDKSFDPYLFINHFEEGFRKAVELYVGENGKLIIFIDDLDRCIPESALIVLESVKLYLDQSNCVFFIGLDKRVVDQAVSQKYQYSSSSITGKEYLEKIIRLNFFIPEKSPSSVEKILQVGLNAGYALDTDRWKLIQMATGSNIRKVKQFIIAFDLIDRIVRRINVEQRYLPNLAKLLLIQLNYPIFFDALMSNNSLLRKFEHFFEEEEEFFKIKKRMLADTDGKEFANDDSLMNFLIHNRTYPGGFSNEDEIKKALQLLSQSGAETI